MAQGAVNSLVGRLTALLIDEAQLLGGVRGDVEFIKEEMESMNSLLLHLTEAQHRAHHVRTWMKQVAGLARDCEAYVELHVQSIGSGIADPRASKGLLGYLQRILRLLRTIPARHRIATRIRELKVRARDVGDRRLRYGVTVPSAADQESAIFIDVQASREPGRKKDAGRCSLLEADGGLLDDDDQTRVNNGIDRLIEWLSEDAPAAAEGRPRVFSVLWKYYRLDLDEEDDDESEYESNTPSLDPEEREETVLHDSNDDSGSGSESYSLRSWDDVKRESALAACIARGVYQHPSVVSSFGCKARSSVTDNYGRMKPLGLLFREILEQVAPLPAEQEDTLRTTEAEELSTEKSQGDEEHEATQLAKKLQGYLKGKRFLIVLEDVPYRLAWDSISSALLHVDDDCPPGSAIIMTTSSREVAESSSPRKIFEAQSLYAAFRNKAEELIGAPGYCPMEVIESILQYCHPDAFAMKMALHLLYVNPNKTEDELMKISESLSECERLNKSIAKQMLMFCYKELPSKYWSCLMYLSIFPKYHIIRRTSLARRWIAEGLITANIGTAMDRSMHQASATDEAERCFNALVTRGFVLPWEISTACNIKSIRVHDEVREFITGIAADVSFVDTNLPPHLAHHLSIHSRIGLRATDSSHLVETDGDGNCIAAYLPYLAKLSQWQLLKVLDLEGCKGLKKKHLKNICKILLLKYLSLRNTDVTEIPKQFEKLQCLETLDIRQTALRALATKSFMLPMLKYLLAGQADSSSNSSVCLPSGIRRMKNLEIMSHVEVSDNVDDLTDVGQLLQLRKLGVILHAKNGGLGLLFQQIEKLYDCLRSLSIRINQPVRSEGTDAEEVVALVSPPKLLLENLNISEITSGLPLWIAELNQLVKITLSETDLEEDALGIIGNLRTLSCLRLRHKSYTRRELNFKKKEFKGLKSLVIEGSDITNITFDAGAAPKLEMIVWTFAKMEAISGVIHLPRLKKLELNGDCNPNPVRQAIKDHPNHPVFKHNPYHQGQEAETVIAASTT